MRGLGLPRMEGELIDWNMVVCKDLHILQVEFLPSVAVVCCCCCCTN